jgi:hypothetical protein
MEVAENSAKQPIAAVQNPADTSSQGVATVLNPQPAENQSGNAEIAKAQGFFAPFRNSVAYIKHQGERARHYAISHTSPIIINHSAQILSAGHLASEILMLKAAGVEFFKNKRNGGKVNILIDPLYNLGRGMLGLDKIEAGKANQNHWGIRATVVGFFAWTLGTFVPDKHKSDVESDKEVSDDSLLFRESKLGFLKKRIGQVLNVFDASNKRQQIGFGVMLAGIFTALSGRSAIDGAGNFYLNKSRAIGGMITAVAGSSLWLSITDESAWSRYGAVLWARIPFIATSINKMYGKTMPFRGQTSPEGIRLFDKANREWKYYAAGATGFQSSALASFLVGGAEVKEDGTIITHDTKKTVEQEDPNIEKIDLNSNGAAQDTPKTTVQQVTREANELQTAASPAARAASA